MGVDVRIDHSLISGEQVLLMTRNGTPTKNARLLLYAHGSGQTAAGPLDFIDTRQTLWAIAESGIVVLAITADLFGFGNDVNKAKWDVAIEWAEEELEVLSGDGHIGLGTSMGSITLFNHWKQSPEKWKAIGTLVGLLNLQDLIENDLIGEGGSFAIRGMYGETTDEGMLSHYPTHSPWHYRDDVRDAIAEGALAVRTWGSGNDPVCTPSFAYDFADHCNFEHIIYGDMYHAGPGIAMPDMAAWAYNQR